MRSPPPLSFPSRHREPPDYQPQGNGQTENMNKQLVTSIRHSRQVARLDPTMHDSYNFSVHLARHHNSFYLSFWPATY